MKIEITNIEQLRKVKWVKYKEFEKQTGRSTYRNIVTGKIPATPWSIKKMAQIFEVKETEIKNLLTN